MEPLIAFRWHRWTAGYEIVEARPIGVSLADFPEPRSFIARRICDGIEDWYQPLEQRRGLFRDLADRHEASDDSVLEMAGEVGFLGGSLGSMIRRPGRQSVPSEFAFGELLSDWRNEIQELREVVELIDSLHDEKALRRVIEWRGKDRILYCSPFGTKLDVTKGFKPGAYRIEQGDLRTPAVLVLQTIINRNLKQHPAPSRLLFNEFSGEVALHQVPSNLISAAWLQAAQQLGGNSAFKRCQECSRWYEAAKDRRMDARYCSDACKARAYRKRKSLAEQLSKKGFSAREIAEQLGVRISSVRAWCR